MDTETKDQVSPERAAELAEQEEQQESVRFQRDSVVAASKLGSGSVKGELPPEVETSALEWFLSDSDMPVTVTKDLNVGLPDAPRWIQWVIKPVTGEEIKHAQKMAEEGNRRARRTGGNPTIDGAEANARILVAGTVSPDLRDLAAKKLAAAGMKAPPDPDSPAVELLRWRFRDKSGLIDQLADEILAISGYDDNDIQEHAAGKA